MKTLDELIEILERQIDKTRIKILDKDLLDSVPDALHYLREYKEMKEHLACLDSHTLHGDETERRYDNGNLERY